MKTLQKTLIGAALAVIIVSTVSMAQAGIFSSFMDTLPSLAIKATGGNSMSFISGKVVIIEEPQKIVESPITSDVFLAQTSSPKTSSNPNAPYVTKTRKQVVALTGYSSTPDQTDDTPFITARGTHVRDGIVAANFLPFGTKIKIDGFGDKVFVVEDRMNRRYTNRVDIWFASREEALEFGIRTLTIHIIES